MPGFVCFSAGGGAGYYEGLRRNKLPKGTRVKHRGFASKRSPNRRTIESFGAPPFKAAAENFLG